MPLRVARLLTVMAVAGPCVLAAAHGWSIVRFAAAKAGAAGPEQRADAVRPWAAVPGLAGGALQATLLNVANPADVEATRKRAEALDAILAVHPLSSDNWLSLAALRLVSGQTYDKVLRALAMSWIAGPNEDSLMLRRGIFGLVQWEALPADIRSKVIADLAGAMLATTVRDQEIDPAKSVLKAKTAETRAEIAELLRTQGVAAGNLARMGL